MATLGHSGSKRELIEFFKEILALFIVMLNRLFNNQRRRCFFQKVEFYSQEKVNGLILIINDFMVFKNFEVKKERLKWKKKFFFNKTVKNLRGALWVWLEDDSFR